MECEFFFLTGFGTKYKNFYLK